jgi:hypothetical protein
MRPGKTFVRIVDFDELLARPAEPQAHSESEPAIIPGDSSDTVGSENKFDVKLQSVMKIKLKQVLEEHGVLAIGRKVQILVEIERTNLDADPAIPINDRSPQDTVPGELVGPIAVARSHFRQFIKLNPVGNKLLDPESEPGKMLLEENQETHFVPDSMAENTR